MPIGDLLASISGEDSASSQIPSVKPSPIVPKRKAEDELRGVGVKTPRTGSMTNGSSRPNHEASRPSPRPANGLTGSSGEKSAPVSRPAAKIPDGLQKSSSTTSKAGSSSLNPSASRPLPSRPLVSRPSPTDNGPAPKKRSYAEIMARAQAAQEARASFGKIQHKTIEKALTMKERKELKAEEARNMKNGARQTPAKKGGSAMPSRNGGSNGTNDGNGTASKTASAKDKAAPPVEEKKVKKAALATTGYTGTARPRPGATSSRPGASSRPSSSEAKSRERPRYGGALSRPRRRDDEEDDLDDFIEYDEDEDGPGGYGRRGGYGGSEEEESDMEAGLSDIDAEERRAELVARREDLEQEALEKRLKREKEERKRMQLAAVRSKTGQR
ncbi:hypothetical protein QBC46DRAFT_395716 [Diplogelasinospora grovesii]|uniref:SPT2 chromatin protein n=1 Tax=Diplogelasinospora grovesii TaxID=303347 RepID=A0AAN6S015_9PEZI|nr:hypothetical protein QBC46DRAFT_395716 [Diplogelasinospora grovesii]